MATFKVTKAKRANGFTLGSLQRCLTGVSKAELDSSPTLKRVCEIVEEGLTEAKVGDYEDVVERRAFSFGSEFLELQEVDEEWMSEEVS
ncbi:hypothetical protein Q9L58_002990 [Maublancomyces gigas]|uniref:Uncharacterized protein n=1 Tax=Discina gigas TaxID=1032678 RepID=A0ABR3GQ45_9PEZI